MDERESVINGFMSWLAEAGYDVTLFDMEYETYKPLDEQVKNDLVARYLNTTAETKEWKRDSLLNIDNSET